MPRRERECMKGAKEEEEWGSWRAPKPDLARANSRVGAPSWRANLAVGAPIAKLTLQFVNFAVGARQVPSRRANFDLASKKVASTQKTHILHHNNKATQPKAVEYQ